MGIPAPSKVIALIGLLFLASPFVDACPVAANVHEGRDTLPTVFVRKEQVSSVQTRTRTGEPDGAPSGVWLREPDDDDGQVPPVARERE